MANGYRWGYLPPGIRHSRGLICGVPAICSPGSIERVEGLELDDFQNVMIQRSVTELVEERDAVMRILAE
jgi:malate dehydrogenase